MSLKLPWNREKSIPHICMFLYKSYHGEFSVEFVDTYIDILTFFSFEECKFVTLVYKERWVSGFITLIRWTY